MGICTEHILSGSKSTFVRVLILVSMLTVIYLVSKISYKSDWTLPFVDTNEFIIWPRYYEKKLQDIPVDPQDFKSNLSCNKSFYPEMEKNMKKVLSYPVVQQMKMMYPDIFSVFDQQHHQTNKEIPVIVTATSSNHYHESLAMIDSAKKTVMKFYKTKLILFDLGLTQFQKTLQKFCNCEVRTFPFIKYPPFVSILNNYAWKPLIIYEMLNEFEFIIWADASVNFHGTKGKIDLFLNRTREVGILIQKINARTLFYTKSDTFKHLHEHACLFDFKMLAATFISFFKTNFTFMGCMCVNRKLHV